MTSLEENSKDGHPPGDPKRVSVIIPFHNRSRYLRTAVESALAAIDPQLDEILVIDDGSTDGSADTLKGLPITLFRSERQQGPAAARNVCLRKARGRFITFLDSDDILQPDAIEERVRFLNEQKQEIAVGGSVRDLIDPEGKSAGPYHAIHFFHVHEPPYRLSRDFLLRNRSLPLHLWLVLFRREVFDEIGELDSWLRCGEDFDFFCRLLEKHSIPFIPCQVARYRIHDENVSIKKTLKGLRATETAVASQILICQKNAIPLKESPFTVETYFQFQNIGIKLIHDRDPVGKRIENEFGRWKCVDKISPQAEFKVIAGLAPREPELGSVRTRYWEEFKSYEYRLGEKMKFDYLGDNYHVRRNFEVLSTEVSYLKPEGLIEPLACSAFKWLVIKALEKKGFGYIHGAAIALQGKQIIFTGDPGSGKSSCLKRLTNHGALAVTDDTVLFKDGQIFPFDHSPTVRGDFPSRFHIAANSEPLKPEQCRLESLGDPVVAVVFPRVWTNTKSEWRPVAREEALQRLMATYVKETDWNTVPENEKAVRAQYESFLKHSQFFEFFGASDEAGADAVLWDNCKKLLGA